VTTRVICADPPWAFSDSLPGKSRGASKSYRCLPLHEIMRFPLPDLADNCVLFLWRVSAMQEEALQVVRAWGFKPHSEMVWVKLTVTGKKSFGMGRIVRGAHETCIIAVRGRNVPESRRERSVFEAPIGEHSAKPEQFYDIVERMFPGPYAELFARRQRDGWSCFGDELPNTCPADVTMLGSSDDVGQGLNGERLV